MRFAIVLLFGIRLLAQDFKLARVDFIMLGVKDMNESITFYRDKLGLEVTRKSDDIVMFRAGTVTLTLSSEVGRKIGDEEIVFSVEHVQSVYAALRNQGIVFDRRPHALTEESWAASFRDPDGHILSIYGPR